MDHTANIEAVYICDFILYNFPNLLSLQKSFKELISRSFQLAFSLWNISLKEGELSVMINLALNLV